MTRNLMDDHAKGAMHTNTGIHMRGMPLASLLFGLVVSLLVGLLGWSLTATASEAASLNDGDLVQSINTGSDVDGNQFDLQIGDGCVYTHPGGAHRDIRPFAR